MTCRTMEPLEAVKIIVTPVQHACTIHSIDRLCTVTANTSLVRHTPQSQGKRGLVTMCTVSCTSAQKPVATNQIQDFEFTA